MKELKKHLSVVNKSLKWYQRLFLRDSHTWACNGSVKVARSGEYHTPYDDGSVNCLNCQKTKAFEKAH